MDNTLSLKDIMERSRASAKELRQISVKRRMSFVSALKTEILKNEDHIIGQIEKETGKTRLDAYTAEIFSTLEYLQFLEKTAARALGDRKVPTPPALLGKKSCIYLEPFGTVLVISPWNYPFYLGIAPIASAFAAGNSVVFKPSEHTPLKGLLEKLFEKVGFKNGWIQVVYGDGGTAKQLIDEKPDKIFFTGSTATGQKVMDQASKHLIPVELELGGKDPMIVFESANIKRAVRGAAWGGFTNCGQVCVSVERLFVQESIYEEFKRELVNFSGKLTGSVNGGVYADIGRITPAFQIKKIADQLGEAVSKGANIISGGDWDRKSAFIPPIIIENVSRDSALLKDETFGPILPLVSFKTEEEAIKLANDTEYGLSASVWTGDRRQAERVARALAAGSVSVNNVMITLANSALPFGGIKKSGFGRYKGNPGYLSFVNIKSVVYDRNNAPMDPNWFPYSEKKYGLFKKITHGLFGGGIINFIRFVVNGIKLNRT